MYLIVTITRLYMSSTMLLLRASLFCSTQLNGKLNDVSNYRIVSNVSCHLTNISYNMMMVMKPRKSAIYFWLKQMHGIKRFSHLQLYFAILVSTHLKFESIKISSNLQLSLKLIRKMFKWKDGIRIEMRANSLV